MYIKNKTSEVPVSRSIAIIMQRVIEAGGNNVRQVVNEETKKPCALYFTLKISGNDIPFKLPVRVDELEKIMLADLKVKNWHAAYEKSVQRIKSQAERTAWKVMVDWIEVQLTMIMTGQAEAFEIFLPYAYSIENDKTFFGMIKENPGNTLKLLGR